MSTSIADRWHKITDAVLGTLEDLKPVTTRTARKRAHRASQIGVEVGLQQAKTAVLEELNASMAKRLRGVQ